MNDSPGESEDADKTSPWLRANPNDLEGLDFEGPIVGSTAADSGELADLYRSASQTQDGSAEGQRRARVWDLLSGVTGMYFKPGDGAEPFGPMLVLTDGRRSAIAADFRGHVVMLQTMSRAASNVVLKARLSDLAWLLDRKQAALGGEAIEAYVDLVGRIEACALKFRHAEADWRFHHETRDYLLRALTIGRMLGWTKPEAAAARAQLMAVRKRAVEAADPVPVHWFCSLDLRMRVSDPEEIAAELESVLGRLPDSTNHHVVVDLWRLAAQAYQAAKREADKHRCQTAAAEAMVAQAEKVSSAMLASELIGNAIAALHGVPTGRARRLELRHRLVDVQARVGEEMTTYSQEMDLSELVTKVQDQFTPTSVFDSLFLFAVLEASPDPEKLRTDATDMIRKHPLSSLFGTAHLDDEGKVIHRTDGGALGGAADPAIAQQIAQAESLRRNIAVAGKIELARQTIITQHYLGDDVFYALTSQSPFVPPDLAETFARGFTRLFQGDFTSALYILTPLLENSLRHVLKAHGHDVTTFDNAGQTQEDRTISAMFEQMRPELDAIFTQPLTEDIEHLFLGRPGPAIRHGVAHGLLHDGSPYGADGVYACWLIFRLCLIPLFPYRRQLGLA